MYLTKRSCCIIVTRKCEAKMEWLSDVGTIRYMLLVHRHKLIHDNSLYFNGVRKKYIYNGYKVSILTEECDFKSMQITLPAFNPIASLCCILLDKLMLTPIDTLGGLCAVCEQPMGNPIMLNIARLGALRQYYGRNIGFKSKIIVTRVTYGYGSKRNSVGTDPN